MDKNLLQGIVMLGLCDRKPIEKEILAEYLKCYFGKEEYPLNFIEFYELIGQTAQMSYSDDEIRTYCKRLFNVAQEVFKHEFDSYDLDIILSCCSAQQASHRSVNIFEKFPAIAARLSRDATTLPGYAASRDLGMFYFAYKLNSY